LKGLWKCWVCFLECWGNALFVFKVSWVDGLRRVVEDGVRFELLLVLGDLGLGGWAVCSRWALPSWVRHFQCLNLFGLVYVILGFKKICYEMYDFQHWRGTRYKEGKSKQCLVLGLGKNEVHWIGDWPSLRGLVIELGARNSNMTLFPC